jgi:hypothetical protein
MICRSSRFGGKRVPLPGGGLIGLTMGTLKYNVLPAGEVPLNGMLPVVDRIPDDGGYDMWLTTAHELGHSLGLGDEYGEFDTPPPPDYVDFVNATFANLQSRSVLEDADHHLRTDRLRWAAWPRISAAAVLTAPTALDDDLQNATVTVAAADARAFKKGDVVRLRTRPLAVAGPPSKPFRIDKFFSGGAIVLVPILKPVVDSNLAAAYPPGSVLLRAVRSNADPQSDRRLVVQAVLDRINETGNPLNADPADKHHRNCKNEELILPTAATNFINHAAPKPPFLSHFTIGVYENASGHFCGIYRPTGICIMATQSFNDFVEHCPQAYQFCLICRYAIVDAIDPTLHPAVDAQFVARYGDGK